MSIPDEIPGLGFNNDPLAKVIMPNLISVDYSGDSMGETVAF